MRPELVQEKSSCPWPAAALSPPAAALTDAQLKSFMDRIGRVYRFQQLRDTVAAGGVEPSLRKVVWRLLLGVFREDLSGAERMAFMAERAAEYRELKEHWKKLYSASRLNASHLSIVTAIGKDVIRTDRGHPFFAGNNENSRSTQLFDLLATYAIYHPSVGYAQGMSDMAAPLLMVQEDEAHAYVCFCALMRRLGASFHRESSAMLTKLQHFHDVMVYLDPVLAAQLRERDIADMWWAHRWLLLELKREFPLDESLRILEMQWALVPCDWLFKDDELYMIEVNSTRESCLRGPSVSSSPKDTPYLRLASLRHQSTQPRRQLLRSNAVMDSFCFDEDSVRQIQQQAPTAEEVPSVASASSPAPAASPVSSGGFIVFKDVVIQLAPPEVLGAGNPFLLFLCFTLVQMYRDRVLASCHDLCDISTLFMRTQRKHDVQKLVNRARHLFQTYLCDLQQRQQQLPPPPPSSDEKLHNPITL